MGNGASLNQVGGAGGDIRIEGGVTGTGIAIGHGARVEINYRVVAEDLLRTPLRHQFDGLLEKYTELFAGRERIFQSIAEFINNPAGGYLAITAPAGFGKTALMAELISVTPDAYAYHFFAPQYRSLSVEEERFLRNVVDQMASWYGIEKAIPTELDDLASLYEDYLGREGETTRVLVLDGLDEVTRWELHPYLSRRLKAGVHVIVTARDIGPQTLDKYQFPDDQLTRLRLSGLKRDEVAEVFRAAGGPAANFAADEELLDRFVADAAYESDKKQGSDPFYVRLLAEDVSKGDMTAQDIAQKAPGLKGYLDKWLESLEEAAEADGQEKSLQETIDLLGILTVAQGPIGRNDLETIIPGLKQGLFKPFPRVIKRVRRFVYGDDQRGYSFMHPRLRGHLLESMGTTGSEYWDQLLTYCAGWRDHRSHYALTYYVEQLHTAGDTKTLYKTVLDEEYRRAQLEVRGDVKASDYDLRLALKLALEQDRPVLALACIAAYRDMIRSQSMAKAIFAAIDGANGDRRLGFERALQLATFYGQATGWPRTLYTYLAWEAALGGWDDLVETALKEAGDQPAGRVEELSDALLVRLARALGDGSDAQTGERLLALGRADATVLVDRYQAVPSLTEAEAQPILERIDQTFIHMEQMYQRGDAEAIHDVRGMEDMAEESTYHVRDLRDALWRAAGTPAGRQKLERFMNTTLANPYPRYRDIGLVEFGVVCAAISREQDSWLRQMLRRMLQAGLDWEGVTFTFDLPALFLAEAQRRDLPRSRQGDLARYCDTAREQVDRWGTIVRALSAGAAAEYRLGDQGEAIELLRNAAGPPAGFAGFATVHMLALANRWSEFRGSPQVADAGEERGALVARAVEQAEHVRDEDFRRERRELVDLYEHWTKDEMPDVEAVETAVKRLRDSDKRMAYLDILSARWAGEAIPYLDGIKTLLPLALLDGTTLDAVLARLYGLYLSDPAVQIDEDDLAELIRLCQASMMTGQPWALEPVPESGVYIRRQ